MITCGEINYTHTLEPIGFKEVVREGQSVPLSAYDEGLEYYEC